MKYYLLGICLACALIIMPWRLMALVAETLVAQPGRVQTSAGDDGYWRTLGLQDQLEDWGWDVEYAPIRSHGILGVTNVHEHIIVIDVELHWRDRYTVLAHEAAHTLQPGWLDKQDEEIFAESVAALLDPHGLREHARYLATRKMRSVFTSIVLWRQIYTTAGLLNF